MSNPAKAAGTRWETEAVDYLNQCNLEARRYRDDPELSDIWAGDWTIEAKAEARIDLPGYLKQLAASVAKAHREPWKSAVYVKNRRHPAGKGYAVMEIEEHRALMLYVTAMEGHLREATAALAKHEEWCYG
jgi:hypothetical protein